MKYLLLVVCMLAIAGCNMNQEYAEADEMTLDTVGAEWLELVKQPPSERRTFTPEEIDRRQRKIDAWTYRIEKALKKERKDLPPKPTEEAIAQATLKDLGR